MEYIIALLWYLSGVATFVLLSRKLLLSGFSLADIPMAMTYGGLSGPLGLLILAWYWLKDRATQAD